MGQGIGKQHAQPTQSQQPQHALRMNGGVPQGFGRDMTVFASTIELRLEPLQAAT